MNLLTTLLTLAIAAATSTMVSGSPIDAVVGIPQIGPPLCSLPRKVPVIDDPFFANHYCQEKLCINMDDSDDYSKDAYIEPTVSKKCQQVKCNKHYTRIGDGAFATGTCSVERSTEVVLQCRNGATMRVTTSQDGKTIRWQALKESHQGHHARLSFQSDSKSGVCKQPTLAGVKRVDDTLTEQVSLYCDIKTKVACL